MKGQFFIVGAVILIIAISSSLQPQRTHLSVPTEDIPRFSTNLQREFPRAFNFGTDAGTPVDTLVNFSRFVNNTMEHHYVNFSIFWVVATGDGTSDLTFTAGNFLGENVSLSINLSGGALPAIQTVTVPDHSTASLAFNTVPATFNATISYRGETEIVELVRDKSSMYALLEVGRGKETNREEIVM